MALKKNPLWGTRGGWTALDYDRAVSVERAAKKHMYSNAAYIRNIGVAVVGWIHGGPGPGIKIAVYAHSQVSNANPTKFPPTFMLLDRENAEKLVTMLLGALQSEEI